MKTKLKEVKDDFYAFSSKASDISRQLALAGVAIIWLFKTESTGHIELSIDLIQILKLLVICLLLDFCHAFIPSIIYGIMNNNFRFKQMKSDEDDVIYSLWWTLPEWIFFLSKVIVLLCAYSKLWSFLEMKLPS